MKKSTIIQCAAACCCVILAGCQTRITAEKNAEIAHPIQQLVNVDGTNRIITTGYCVTSGGWYATARSPLYAREELRGLSIGVGTNGTVSLSLDSYDRDVSTNAIVMVREMFSGGAQLATAIGDAYVKIAGGGAQAATALDVAKKVYSSFAAAGGDVTKATVSTDSVANTLKVSDGSTCVECSADGTCTTCSP